LTFFITPFHYTDCFSVRQIGYGGKSFIKECGLPTKLSRLKSTVEITPEVLRQVADTCNIIKAGPRELSRDEIYEILMECL